MRLPTQLSKLSIQIKKVTILIFIMGILLGLGIGLLVSVNMVKSANEMSRRFSILAEKAIYMSDIVRVTDVAYIVPVAVYASYNILKANSIAQLKMNPEIYLERPIDLVNITLSSLSKATPPSEVEEFHKLLVDKFSTLLNKLLEYKKGIISGSMKPEEALKMYKDISDTCNEILNLAKAISNTLKKTV